jgi:hypothetical protein
MARATGKSRTTAPKQKTDTIQEDIDDILGRKKPITRHVEIWLDDERRQALEDAEAAVEAARAEHDGDPDDTTKAVALFEALEALGKVEIDVEGERVTFTFRSIGRIRYDALQAKHPPTDEQIQEMEAALVAAGRPPDAVRPVFNIETFVPALFEACCVNPKMNLAQATELWQSEDFSESELSRLLVAARGVNSS